MANSGDNSQLYEEQDFNLVLDNLFKNPSSLTGPECKCFKCNNSIYDCTCGKSSFYGCGSIAPVGILKSIEVNYERSAEIERLRIANEILAEISIKSLSLSVSQGCHSGAMKASLERCIEELKQWARPNYEQMEQTDKREYYNEKKSPLKKRKFVSFID